MIGSRTALIALILATSSALAGAKGAERLTVGI
jgi:hypothetical protein